MPVRRGDCTPGTDSGIPGPLSKGFTECVDIPDERANQVDSDVLREPGKVGPRDIDVPQEDPEREEFQRGGIEPIKSPWTT